FGGYMGATLTNVINVVMIYLGVIAGFIAALNNCGGWEHITLSLPQGSQWFSLFEGVGPVIIVGWVGSMVIQSPPNQGLIQATAAGRSEKAARFGT
ncbi:sodium:solute symporter family protein, partial [Eubacterium callanderi]|nr:sodium:solute symporter family protein [Eubacterium callanderi]